MSQLRIAKWPMFYGLLLSALAITSFNSGLAHAELPQPSDGPLLTITGKIRQTNAEDRAEFDRELLEQLGLVKLTTSTPWTKGEREFEGVSFVALLGAIGANGSTARAVAANDYIVDIPISDLLQSDALLAMSMDGKRLRLRDKGPLWIIYPWSQRPELDRSEFHSYAVWQLLSLHIH